MSLLSYQPKRQAHIVSGRANPELAQDVAAVLGTELTPCLLEDFSDGSINAVIGESVRGDDVYVIQSHRGPGMDINKAIAEQESIISAAHSACAGRVVAVFPWLGGGRSDRITGRHAIESRVTVRRFERAGAQHLVSVDLHSRQIQGFTVDATFDNLTAAPVLREAILPRLIEGVVVVSPDPGRAKAASSFRRRLPPELRARAAYIDKIHPEGTINQVEVLEVVGDVAGRQCLINDDMVDTGGTQDRAAAALRDRGASEILAVATHGVLSGAAVKNIGESAIEHIILTDSLALADLQPQMDKLEVASIAGLLAKAIKAIFENGSISALFEDNEHTL